MSVLTFVNVQSDLDVAPSFEVAVIVWLPIIIEPHDLQLSPDL